MIKTDNARLVKKAAAEVELESGEFILIKINDTGTGMPEAVKAHAIEPFFTTKEIGAGSGIGLSMVYGFVAQSGGHVKIDSAAGQGTAVTLYLPCVHEEEAVEVEEPGSQECLTWRHGKKI